MGVESESSIQIRAAFGMPNGASFGISGSAADQLGHLQSFELLAEADGFSANPTVATRLERRVSESVGE